MVPIHYGKATVNAKGDSYDAQNVAYIRPNLHKEYNHSMEEYLNLRHGELIPIDCIHEQPSYYQPNHPVINEGSTTTKLRVVFNTSQTGPSGKSLTDLLLTEPTIQ